MRFDLKTPCRNCPFRTDRTAIRFATEGRAAEIEEHAYRQGFPCHKSADFVEDEDTFDGESGGYVPGANTQYCAGHIVMQLKENGDEPWPGISNDEELAEKLATQMDMDAPVFESGDDFIRASRPKPVKSKRRRNGKLSR